MAEEFPQKAGSININQLRLIGSDNRVWDLTTYLVELNIYEDLFSSHLYGDIVLSDSTNLLDLVPIIGEEVLIVDLNTPTSESKIKKTFRVFKLSNRKIIRDDNTQMFTLHFASIELFYDILLPLFVPFEGNITDVVAEIFSNYIIANRNFAVDETTTEVKEVESLTNLVFLDETKNKVKFVSPGWSPFKCINWLASKAIPLKNTTAKNYLFFESNKAFYFGSIEHIFKQTFQSTGENQAPLIIGEYFYATAGQGQDDIIRDYFVAKDVEMIDTTDHVKNYTNGYLANRLISLDIYNKKVKITDYDYVDEYKNQFHSSGAGYAAGPDNTKRPVAIPVFLDNSLRNPASSISFYPINPKLFDNFADNINEMMPEIYGNRKSSLLDLTNVRMNITVPGRTDIEVGRVLKFSYPFIGPRDAAGGIAGNKEDTKYSGYYLITAIRHKINCSEHIMRMEIIKDSLLTEETTATS